MRLMTKAILILSLIALCVFVLYITGRRDPPGGVADAVRPRARPADSPATPRFDDPLAASVEKWRQQLKHLGPAPGTDAKGATPAPAAVDLKSSAQKEGLAAALPKEEVLGADPPGPFLRPDRIKGETIAPAALAAPQPQETARYHLVQEGDTLSEIARQYYGSPAFWPRLEQANPGIDPNALRVGARIVLPDSGAPKPEKPAAVEKPAPGPQVYVVRDGDTLIRIARRVYGNAAFHTDIYEANRDVLSSPNATLHVGQRLRLPPKT
jgi:nucleoid-associated protein YgaU